MFVIETSRMFLIASNIASRNWQTTELEWGQNFAKCI